MLNVEWWMADEKGKWEMGRNSIEATGERKV